VKRECSFERLAKAGDRLVARILLVRPRSVPAVDGAISVEEHRREGEVVIELELGEIQRVRIDDPRAYELIEQRPQFRLLQHLRIDACAGETWHTTQDDEDRLARLFSFGKCALEIVVDPARIVLHRRAILSHRAFAVFYGFAIRRQRADCKKGDDARGEWFHPAVLKGVSAAIKNLPGLRDWSFSAFNKKAG
jgi:hypothetical protein